ncbi:hypothetical protein [Marinobacter sp. MBR-105]|jgi:hypothetical protein
MKATDFDQHPELGDNFWGSDPQFPVADWQQEVANDDTRLGYWDWVQVQREQADDEHE